jgi:hypothetical protein
MNCSVCNHPERPAIDQALVSGSNTLVALAQKYNLSTSALHRHKAHLQAKVGRAKAKLMEHLHQGCIFWLSQALEMTMQTAQAAQAESNANVVLRALSQGTRLVNIILKHDLPLDDRLVYEILISPQWANQTGLLPADPGLMSLGRQSLAATLSSPCPETPADAPTLASPDELALMQQFLHILGSESAPATSADNRKLETENRFFKREKSGKLPGKTTFIKKNTKAYQKDSRLEKSAGKNSASWIEDLDAGRLNVDLLNAIGVGRKLPEPQPISSDVLAALAAETETV